MFTINNKICGLVTEYFAKLENLNEKIFLNFLILFQGIAENMFNKNIKPLIEKLIENESYDGISRILSSIPILWTKFYRKRPPLEMLKVVDLLVANLNVVIKNKC